MRISQQLTVAANNLFALAYNRTMDCRCLIQYSLRLPRPCRAHENQNVRTGQINQLVIYYAIYYNQNII